jgi:hypothetical protein
VRNVNEHSFLREVLIGIVDAIPHPRRVTCRGQHDNKNQIQEIFQTGLV